MTPRRVVTRAQLYARGLSRSAVEHGIADRRLFVIHRGVYAIGRPDLPPDEVRLAAVLALGPTAVLSHTSAAQVHNLDSGALHPVHVTLPGSGRSKRAGIRVHRSITLEPQDLTVVKGIPVTSVSRTLLDLAAILPAPRLARAVEQAERIRAFDLRRLQRVIDRNRRTAGATRLRTLLAAYTGAPETESELERGFLDFLDAHGLPHPQLQAKIGSFRVDAFWPEWRLVVELDSVEFHFTRRSFQEDRIRDEVLQRLQLRVLRLTSERLKQDAAGVCDAITDFARNA